jgi:hypothetical protein
MIQAKEVVPADIGTAEGALFALGWDSGDPHLRLIEPGGRVISETTQAADVLVAQEGKQTMIGIRNPTPGTWTAEVYNLTGSETYDLAVLQSNVPPEVQILSPSAPGEAGFDSYLLRWEAVDLDDQEAKVSLYYATSDEGPSFPIATGLPLGQTSLLWDTSAVPTGEYQVYVEVRDGENVPQGAWSTGTVQVWNLDAPPTPSLSGLEVDQQKGTALAKWSGVSAPDLEGYRLYFGYGDGVWAGVLDTGLATNAELLALEPNTPLYVAVTAYDSTGNESALSAQASAYLGVYRVFLPSIDR